MIAVTRRKKRSASGGRGRPDERIVADRSDAFQSDLAGALDGDFVVLLEQDGADEADDGGLVGLGPELMATRRHCCFAALASRRRRLR